MIIKIISGILALFLVLSLTMLIMEKINLIEFLIIAGITWIIAYKILPSRKK